MSVEKWGLSDSQTESLPSSSPSFLGKNPKNQETIKPWPSSTWNPQIVHSFHVLWWSMRSKQSFERIEEMSEDVIDQRPFIESSSSSNVPLLRPPHRTGDYCYCFCFLCLSLLSESFPLFITFSCHPLIYLHTIIGIYVAFLQESNSFLIVCMISETYDLHLRSCTTFVTGKKQLSFQINWFFIFTSFNIWDWDNKFKRKCPFSFLSFGFNSNFVLHVFWVLILSYLFLIDVKFIIITNSLYIIHIKYWCKFFHKTCNY